MSEPHSIKFLGTKTIRKGGWGGIRTDSVKKVFDTWMLYFVTNKKPHISVDPKISTHYKKIFGNFIGMCILFNFYCSI